MSLQVPDNIAKFMRGKPGIDCKSQIVKPKFGFPAARANMDVSRLVAFV
jgi:hypothetical protein